ncbi:MAG TPA: hypothetical protein VFL14_15465 [Xanthomonadales bacterium]|nr:hypothetical protein [Xanthomonadales bacterium]
MRRLIPALFLAAVATPALAAPTIALVSGQPAQFNIPGNAYTNSFYVDVGPNDQQLSLALSGPAGGDLDLLLRYGSPFPDTGPTGAARVDHLFEVAQYRSNGASATESIAIGRSNNFPVRQGRWFVSVVNFTGTAANATLQATLSGASVPTVPIELVFNDPSNGCQIAPWDDSSPRSPVGGNSGTTLGQQRRLAAQEAVRILAQYRSTVPVRVQACWSTSQGPGGGNGGVTLAASGPNYLVRNLAEFNTNGTQDLGERAPFLPRNYTWYPNTLLGKLAGTRPCNLYATQSAVDECTLTDFGIDFNLKVDTEGRGFYYGFDGGAQAAGKSDFVTVAAHEMTHGLGFISTVEVDADNGTVGAKFFGYDDAFSANLVDVQNEGAGPVVRFLDETSAQREAALNAFVQIRWDGAEAVTSTLNTFRGLPAPDNYIKMYTTTPIQPGSTLSHIGFANSPELMNPTINNGLRTTGLSSLMLNAVGWSDAPKTLPPDGRPRSTQYFDPAHPGHGIDVEYAGGNVYVVIFYTYGANGEPEWYLAQGEMLDNVFIPQANANGDTLVRYRYAQGGNPPQTPDPNVRGQIRLDFNQSANAPACRDGVVRDTSSPPVVMTWSIGGDRNQRWCMQSLIPTSLRTTPDFTGSWYAGADSGWGFSLLGIKNGAQNGLFGLLYYPDSQGNGRWAYLQTGGTTNALTLKERRGYCRTCAPPASALAGNFTDVDAGTITLTLTTPSDSPAAGNKVTLNVNYQTPPAGNFQRNDSPLILLSAPQQ